MHLCFVFVWQHDQNYKDSNNKDGNVIPEGLLNPAAFGDARLISCTHTHPPSPPTLKTGAEQESQWHVWVQSRARDVSRDRRGRGMDGLRVDQGQQDLPHMQHIHTQRFSQSSSAPSKPRLERRCHHRRFSKPLDTLSCFQINIPIQTFSLRLCPAE